MAKRIIELADGVANAIYQKSAIVVRRRYLPYYEAKDVVDGKWFVVISEEDANIKRHVDVPKLTVDLGFQQALNEPTDAIPNPSDDLSTIDAMMEKVENVKLLFSEDGALRRETIANCVLQSYRHAPLYRQDFLYEMGIFFSVIRLEYLAES